MKIYFRFDANNKIGFAHLKRAIDLIKFLGLKKNLIFFIIKYYNQKTIKLIKDSGFKFIKINKNYSCLQEAKSISLFLSYNDKIIFDISNINFYKNKFIRKYFKIIYKKNKNITIIDGVFPYNIYRYIKKYFKNYYLPYYTNLKVKKVRKKNILISQNYFLLDNSFVKYRKNIKFQRKVKKVLICFGGSDPKETTIKIMKYLNSCKISSLKFNIVIGPLFTDRLIKKIRYYKKYSKLNFNLIYKPNSLSNYIKNSDIAVSSNGHLKYELIYMKIPSLFIPINLNYAKVDKDLKKLNLGLFMQNTLSKPYFLKSFMSVLNSEKLRYKYYKNCKSFFSNHDPKKIKNLI